MLYRQYLWCAGFRRDGRCGDGRFRWKIGHGHHAMDPTRVDFRPKASGPKPFPTPPSKPCSISKFKTCEATVTQQQQQIETLTAQLKEQAAQIQKVNAQLEMRKPATK